MNKYAIELLENRWEQVVELLLPEEQEKFWQHLNSKLQDTELLKKISVKRYFGLNRLVVLDSNELKNIPEDLYSELNKIATNILQEEFIYPSLNLRINEKPKLPLNSLFVAMQKSENIIGKGEKRTIITTKGFLPRNTKEQALYLSIVFSLAYYSRRGFNRIRLTDLMKNIGCSKKVNGYLESQKIEVLDMLTKIAENRITTEDTNGKLPYHIKKLFPNNLDRNNSSIPIYDIKILKLYTSDKKLKEAIINFIPYFYANEITYDKTSDILSLPLSEPEFKNLAIFLTYGKRLNGKKIILTPRDICDIIKIQPTKQHPKRTYQIVKRILDKVAETKLVTDIDMKNISSFHKNWFQNWFNMEITFKL